MTGQSYEIVIKDSCLLFDLLDLELIDPFFQLKLDVCTTIEVIEEVTDPEQRRTIDSCIENGYLRIEATGSLDEITALSTKYVGLSLNDCTVLELAVRKQAMVLTSDQLLKKISVSNGLRAHGLLWIIDRLINESVLEEEKAIEALVAYSEINKRAPITEIDQMKTLLTNRINSKNQNNA